MFVPKCVLSRSPWNSVTNECDRDCIIMTIYGEIRTLAFTRPGYKAWIDIESPSRAYDDIAFYKGNFYAVDAHGEVFACRIDDNQKVVAKAVAPRPEGTEDLIKKYIVESAGDLLLVLRVRGGHYYSIQDEFNNVDSEDDIEDDDALENEYEEEVEEEEEEEEEINDNSYVTIGFTVLKLKRSTQAGSKYKYKYEKVDNLGDRALFVGDNSSVSLSASSLNGCKANCIYFTDDNIELYEETLNGGGYDMGVFSMKDGTFDKHYPESFSYYSTPLWFI
ncbi:putative F-box protein At5g55150 [Quercus suber]|uniref:F-box protein n=1 Tax=Quercus suber TaxID=58331 RepID=A0AAW0KUS1_QUESU